MKLAARGHELLRRFDAQYLAAPVQEVQAYLAECNQQLADCARQMTDALLDQVLFAASSEMKNAFARSDA